MFRIKIEIEVKICIKQVILTHGKMSHSDEERYFCNRFHNIGVNCRSLNTGCVDTGVTTVKTAIVNI